MRKVVKSIIALLFVILSGIFTYHIVNINLLPNKYLYLGIGVMLLINIISSICLFVKKKWTKVISVLIYLIIIILSVVGFKYVNTTNEFLDKSFDNYKEETVTYHVMVRKDSKYKSLKNIEGFEVNYYSFYNDTDKIKKELDGVLSDYTFKERDDLYDTFINFMVGKTNVLILSDGTLDILDEYYKNLDKRLRDLYSFSITSKVKVEEEVKKKEVNKNHKKIKKGDSINIYISGSDSRSYNIYNKTRSDVNMILSINPKTHTILLTSIPRDYYVYVNGQTKMRDKLTHSGIYGLEASKKTIEDLFDIEIDYSVKVGFNAVVELVDTVGGIEIDSDTDFDSYHIKGWHVNKGINKMNGKKALAYARERNAYSSGDRHRITNQQQVLEAVLNKVMTDKKTLLKYDQILNDLSKFYITDIPRSEVSKYIKDQVEYQKKWKFISQSVDGEGAMRHCYVMPNSNLYVNIPDEQTVEDAREQIRKVLEAK